MATTTVSRAPFVRDRFTWLAYFMLGFFAYAQAALGPAMPFLRAELGLNFTIAGLHISALAVGMIIAGVTGAAIAARWGRSLVFWGGGGGMAAGGLLLIAGQTAPVTIAGAFLMGLLGSYLLIMIPATLSDHHGAGRATALTESNTVASAATTLPPLFIGFFANTGVGWRMVFVLAAVAWATALVFNRRVALPASAAPPGRVAAVPRALPRRFWLVWVMIVLVVAQEWSMVAWSADFMEGSVGLERALASGLMSAYFIAMVIGRFTGSRLTRRVEAITLLPLALALAFTGFMVFWLATVPILNVIGLFVAGLGTANMFPLSLSVATAIAPEQSDRASARVSLAAGIAILIAPQVLGAAADSFGIARAMGLVVVMLLGAAGMYIVARKECVLPGFSPNKSET